MHSTTKFAMTVLSNCVCVFMHQYTPQAAGKKTQKIARNFCTCNAIHPCLETLLLSPALRFWLLMSSGLQRPVWHVFWKSKNMRIIWGYLTDSLRNSKSEWKLYTFGTVNSLNRVFQTRKRVYNRRAKKSAKVRWYPSFSVGAQAASIRQEG